MSTGQNVQAVSNIDVFYCFRT